MGGWMEWQNYNFRPKFSFTYSTKKYPVGARWDKYREMAGGLVSINVEFPILLQGSMIKSTQLEALRLTSVDGLEKKHLSPFAALLEPKWLKLSVIEILWRRGESINSHHLFFVSLEDKSPARCPHNLAVIFQMESWEDWSVHVGHVEGGGGISWRKWSHERHFLPSSFFFYYHHT